MSFLTVARAWFARTQTHLRLTATIVLASAAGACGGAPRYLEPVGPAAPAIHTTDVIPESGVELVSSEWLTANVDSALFPAAGDSFTHVEDALIPGKMVPLFGSSYDASDLPTFEPSTTVFNPTMASAGLPRGQDLFGDLLGAEIDTLQDTFDIGGGLSGGTNDAASLLGLDLFGTANAGSLGATDSIASILGAGGLSTGAQTQPGVSSGQLAGVLGQLGLGSLGKGGAGANASGLAGLFQNGGTTAGFRSANFNVQLKNGGTNLPPDFAKVVAATAEDLRKKLGLRYFGKVFANWAAPIPLVVAYANHSGGGATSWAGGDSLTMQISGRAKELIKDVLPHEILHALLFSLGGNVPLWWHEGIAQLAESAETRVRTAAKIPNDFQRNAVVPLATFMQMKQLPSSKGRVLPFYRQAHSLASFLVGKVGRGDLMQTMVNHTKTGNADAALMQLGSTTNDLQQQWLQWVAKGMPILLGEVI